MSAKRARDEDVADSGASPAQDDSRKPKKAKHGFRVGPENLPDGAWRRKVIKIKKDLITKAKVKKQYAKIKAEYQKQAAATSTPETHPKTAGQQPRSYDDDPDAAPADSQPQIHPERQAMLDDQNQLPRHDNPENPTTTPKDKESQEQNPRQRRPRGSRKQRPDYYTKELAAAEKAKQQAEERRAEAARREQEKQRRIAERERYRKAMAKAKAPGRDGKQKLGREGKLLLEKVKRAVGES